jgi:hypothetical protein
MSHSPRVFVSVSADHHLDRYQRDVKYAILSELKDRNFELSREFEKGPMRKGFGFAMANNAMADVHGAIVLAFAQWECKGLGPRSSDTGLKVSEGNHLEGGLAIAHGLPLLVVRQDGTQDRGIVSEGTTHEVVRMPPASEVERWERYALHGKWDVLREGWVSSSYFQAPFRKWCENVEKRSRFLRDKRVFIGHGHSPAWKDLRDFITGKLSLSYDEFNRISAAGKTTAERLAQMLDDAGIAFLVMTAEDEQKDGKVRARSNVVHEAGLVQGRLGFPRAIVLLENGCEDFSNIHGIGHIAFAKGQIASSFDEVRAVLQREGFLD